MTNIAEVIEREPFSRLQARVLLLTSLAVIVDGFDIQVIAFAGPLILGEWGLTKADLGPVVAAALIGMAIGAPLGGMMGDRFGRRRAVICSALFFGLTTFATAFSKGITDLTLLRLVSGIGFGAMLPNSTALLAEWMPSRFRSHAISVMIIGIPLGGLLGAAVSSALLPVYGWRSCFVFGGALSVILAAALAAWLPESLRFLARHLKRREALTRLLDSAFGQGRFAGADLTMDPPGSAATWKEVLTPPHLRVTLGLAIAFFANLLVFYAFFNWVPTILTSMGMPIEVAIRGSLYYNLWGLLGALVGGALVAAVGSRAGLLLIIAGAIAATGGMAYAILSGGSTPTLVMIGLSAAGATIAGLQAALYALAAGAYPTHCRSTGIGVVAGVGRFGPIASSFAGGIVLSLPGGDGLFFLGVALVLIMAILGVLLVDRHSPPTRRSPPAAAISTADRMNA